MQTRTSSYAEEILQVGFGKGLGSRGAGHDVPRKYLWDNCARLYNIAG
jgi:hypothetical protein